MHHALLSLETRDGTAPPEPAALSVVATSPVPSSRERRSKGRGKAPAPLSPQVPGIY
jgi:hypothetical protein